MARVDRRIQERLTRRRFFTRLIISSLIIISVGLLFISQTDDMRFAPMRNKVESLTSHVIVAINTPFKKIRDIGSNIADLRTLREDNKRLRDENIRLRQHRFRTQTLAAKVRRFEDMMKVQPGLDIPEQPIAVRIISETRGPFAYSVLVNSGQTNGVKMGHPVMHERGMLGHIIRVGKRSSRVLLLEDLNSRISVMSRDAKARAVLIGKNDKPPQLNFYDDTSKWKDGTEVVTSGDGGILPQGLPIGQVIRVTDDDIRVALFARESFDWAWVYPFENMPTPEELPIEDKEIGEGALTSEESHEN